ncbi:MAG TPA: hypothetical protein VG984_02725 [Candidatus Paceibacterota bacterium]|nr:hypothetical protein [Candidatus Paceibacterota bacterium]
MPLALGISLAISSVLGGPQAAPATTPVVVAEVQSVRSSVEEYFADLPIMVAISECESHYRQFNNDGSVFRGKQNTKDVGVMQINEYYHEDTAEKLGFDLYTLDGNMAYARYLYKREGVAPWASSQACWSKSKAAKVVALTAK